MIKYPKTFHIPGSPGATNDDKVMTTLDHLMGHNVIITEKMDGENTTMSRDYIHARSLDSKDHPSRSYVKALHASIAQQIPRYFRICGENLYAKHSIHYNSLNSWFMVFNIWYNNICLSWDDTLEWCERLSLEHVPIMYYGELNDTVLNNTIKYCQQLSEFVEGFVIRRADSFSIDQFGTHIGKWVRQNHVHTDKHWMNQPIIKNKLNII